MNTKETEERIAKDIEAVKDLKKFCSDTTCTECQFKDGVDCRLKSAVSSDKIPANWETEKLAMGKSKIPSYVLGIKGLC